MSRGRGRGRRRIKTARTAPGWGLVRLVRHTTEPRGSRRKGKQSLIATTYLGMTQLDSFRTSRGSFAQFVWEFQLVAIFPKLDFSAAVPDLTSSSRAGSRDPYDDMYEVTRLSPNFDISQQTNLQAHRKPWNISNTLINHINTIHYNHPSCQTHCTS